MSTPDPAPFDAILRRGPSALAWEVLRRDPAYRAAYARLPTLPPTGVAADADFVAHWGLHFPGGSGPDMRPRAADMVGRR
ncbi:transcriptional regulator domain-containing protein [Tardibacter chloracetimidivorans]|uniref:transcriptional regulator domain-containing protein n=1 Tax=Tardibacter chloracetimidivorans TaxID=1921510 RepID=UPI0013012C63|nr:DUF6499 domain-containing protein [Tardibacter chloracetimidivorans]